MNGWSAEQAQPRLDARSMPDVTSSHDTVKSVPRLQGLERVR